MAPRTRDTQLVGNCAYSTDGGLTFLSDGMRGCHAPHHIAAKDLAYDIKASRRLISWAGGQKGATCVVESIFHTHAVRRLYKPDLPGFEQHLLRLDSETRYNRFGLQVADDYLRNYAAFSFKPNCLVYGFIEDGEIRGAAELRVYDAPGRALARNAEVAFSVEQAWRRRGIGTELMGHVVLAARNRHVGEFTIFCLRGNTAMLNLSRKFAADLCFEHNDVTGHLIARPPSAMTYFREFVDNSLDLGSSMLDMQGRLMRPRAVH